MKILDTLGKSKKAIGGIIAIILFLGIVFYAGMMFASKSGDSKITSTGLTQTLQDIDEMAYMQYNYTKVGKFSNSLDINGWSVPLTEKSFLITYSGSLKAGIITKDIKVAVNGDTITVTVPSIKILSNQIDEKSIEVYDENHNIFNPISISDYTAFATQQKEKVEEEAIENGLLSEAATRVEKSITESLNIIPSVKDNYSVEVQMEE